MCLFTGLPFVDIFIQLQWNHSIRFGKSLFIGRYALFFGIYKEKLEVHSRGKRKWQIKNRPYQKGRSSSAVPPLFMYGLRRSSLDMMKTISPHGNGWQPSQPTHRLRGFGVMLGNVFAVQRMHLSAERLLSVLRLICAGYWFPSSLFRIFVKDILYS